MTRRELWAAILACSAAIDRRVAARISDRSKLGPLTNAPARSNSLQLETAWRGLEPEQREARAVGAGALRVIEEAGEVNREGLARLQAEVRAELEQLSSLLGDQRGFGELRKLLLIHFDERIMSTLPDYLRVTWPLLQTEVTGTTTGGDDFYRFLDLALDDPKAPSLVFEIGYYCLRHGFRGRHGRALDRVASYEERLLRRIDQPQLPRSRADDEEARPLSSPWPMWSYYVLALTFVLGLGLVLTAVSNSEPAPEREKGRLGER